MNSQHRNHPEAGSLLVLALFLIVGIGALVSAGAHLAGSTTEATVDDLDATRALYGAESGLEQTKYHLQAQGCSLAALTLPLTGSLASGQAWSVAVDLLEDGTLRLTATGSSGPAQRVVEERIACQGGSPWNGGIVGCEGVAINGNVYIDSGSGTTGIFNLGHGDIRTINPAAHIDLIGGVEVHGQAITSGAGSNLAVGASSIIHADATVTGSISNNGSILGAQLSGQAPTTTAADCDPLDVQALVAANQPGGQPSSLSLSGSSTYNYLAPQTFHVDAFSLGGSVTVNLHGPGEYVSFVAAGGPFEIGGSASLNLLNGATLRVYLTGPMDLGGTGVVNPGSAQDLRVYSSGVGEIEVHGTAEFRGAIYAPLAEVDLQGTDNIIGAVRGGHVESGGTGEFYFDEDLKQIAENGPLVLQTVAWEELF